MTMLEKLNALYGDTWYPLNAKHAALINQYSSMQHDEGDCWSGTCACSAEKARSPEGLMVRRVLFSAITTKKGKRITVFTI